jgi:hypothetical protein
MIVISFKKLGLVVAALKLPFIVQVRAIAW